MPYLRPLCIMREMVVSKAVRVTPLHLNHDFYGHTMLLNLTNDIEGETNVSV